MRRRLLRWFKRFSVLGDGESTLFWHDRWISGRSIKELAPALFAAVRNAGHHRYVARALHHRAWVRDIARALTVEALLDYVHVWELCWRWSNVGCYSSASVYTAMFIGSSRPLGAKQLWKTSAPSKVKNFFRLALHGRCLDC